jgi:hypothetical protein
MARIYVPLSRQELQQLAMLAQVERRPPRDQAALIVAEHLKAHRPDQGRQGGLDASSN